MKYSVKAFTRRGLDFLSRNAGKAMLFGLLAAVLVGAVSSAGNDCTRLSESVLRLRVIANSDSETDQTVKLAVRDEVVRLTDNLIEENSPASPDETAELLLCNADTLCETAEAVLADNGLDYPVRIRLSREQFPVRTYQDRLLPAGTYTALRVELGEAAGENWWCVLFPRLCLPAVSEGWEKLPDIADGTRVSVRVALWDWICGCFG